MFGITVADCFCLWLVLCSTLQDPVNSQNGKESDYAEIQDEPNMEFVGRVDNSANDHGAPVTNESLRLKRSAPDGQNIGIPQDRGSLPVQPPPVPGVPENMLGQIDGDGKAQIKPDQQANFMEMNRQMNEAMINAWKAFSQKGIPIPDRDSKPQMTPDQQANVMEINRQMQETMVNAWKSFIQKAALIPGRDGTPQMTPDQQANLMEINRQMQEAMVNAWKSFNQKGAPIPDRDGKLQMTPDQQANLVEMNRQLQEAMVNAWKSINQKGIPVPDYLKSPFLHNMPSSSPTNHAFNNQQVNVNWNRNGPNAHTEDVPVRNAPHNNGQNLGPHPKVPPSYYQNMLHAYEQFEKLMSQKKHIPNTLGRKNRPAVPPEFLLDETFFYPSLNLDSKGQIRRLPIDNEYSTFTVLVPPGTKDCYFYTPLAHFRIDYQVVYGGGLDIGLFVKAPDGEPIAIRPPVPDASIVINVLPHFRFLPYAICLDNRRATYAEKHSFLSIDLELDWDNPDPYERYVIDFFQRNYNTGDTEISTKLAEFTENINNVSMGAESLFTRLRRIQQLQQRSNKFALSDTALMEDNLDIVDKGSVCQVVVMILVAALQVFLIRSLFDPNSRVYLVWSKKRASLRGTC